MTLTPASPCAAGPVSLPKAASDAAGPARTAPVCGAVVAPSGGVGSGAAERDAMGAANALDHSSRGPSAASDRDDVSRQIIRRLRIVMRALQGHSRSVEQACGVSATALWALWEIERAGELRANDLARRLAVHASTVSNLLDRLESAGLVRRSRSRRDQRVVVVEATEHGRALLAKAPGEPQGLLLAALDRLPAVDRDRLLSALDALTAVLPASFSAGQHEPFGGTAEEDR